MNLFLFECSIFIINIFNDMLYYFYTCGLEYVFSLFEEN